MMSANRRAPGRRTLLLPLLLFVGCDFVQGKKQVRTTADLQTISARIEAPKREAAELENAVASAVASVNDGRDPWGNPYLWKVRRDPGDASYIVLSTGSDGRLDVAAMDVYFSTSGLVTLRTSESARDIVFRNGVAVITGGK